MSAEGYTCEEYTDMILAMGEAQGKAAAAVRIYQEKHSRPQSSCCQNNDSPCEEIETNRLFFSKNWRQSSTNVALQQCNNPMTKEAKLTAAVRILPEWKGYDDEIRDLQKRIDSGLLDTDPAEHSESIDKDSTDIHSEL